MAEITRLTMAAGLYQEALSTSLHGDIFLRVDMLLLLPLPRLHYPI